MRRFVERLPEQPEKVVARETRLCGDLIETQRVIVAVIDKLARPTKPVECVDILQGARLKTLDDHERKSLPIRGARQDSSVRQRSLRLAVVTARGCAEHIPERSNKSARAVVTHFQRDGSY